MNGTDPPTDRFAAISPTRRVGPTHVLLAVGGLVAAVLLIGIVASSTSQLCLYLDAGYSPFEAVSASVGERSVTLRDWRAAAAEIRTECPQHEGTADNIDYGIRRGWVTTR